VINSKLLMEFKSYNVPELGFFAPVRLSVVVPFLRVLKPLALERAAVALETDRGGTRSVRVFG